MSDTTANINDLQQENALKLLSNKKFAKQISTFGVTHFQLYTIGFMVDPGVITDEKQKCVEEFLFSGFGDKKLNENLLQLKKNPPYGYDKQFLENLRYFTHKTRNMAEFQKILRKFEMISLKLKNGQEVPQKEMASLREYAIFQDMIKLVPIMDMIQQKMQFRNPSKFSALHADIIKADSINNDLTSTLATTLAPPTPGVLMFSHIKKTVEYKARSMSVFERLMSALVSKYGHAAKLYNKDKAQNMAASHLNPAPNLDEFTPADYLYCDVFRIKIENLITSENKRQLQLLYGNKWLDVVNQKYSQIERQIHDQTLTNYAGLSAGGDIRRAKTALAAVVPFGLGHKKTSKTHYSKIHEQMMGSYYKDKAGSMLCSEFVAKTTIAALVELENQIKEEAKKNPLVNFKGTMVKIPISEHEKLSKLDPERFLKILKDKKCVERVETPKEYKRFVRSK